MFRWFKKKRMKEQLKLLYQNSRAPSGITPYFEIKGDLETVTRLKQIGEENHRIALTMGTSGFVSFDDLKILLDMNSELRRLYHEAETMGGETRLRELMGQPTKLPDFDGAFTPLLGWDSYYGSM